METSILKSVKKVLGLADDYTAFDTDIIIHINTVFTTLNQLGIGPEEGFAIEDDGDEWTTFLGETPRYGAVKTYMWLKVKILFDPPVNAYLVTSLEKQIQEYEWRLSTNREMTDYVDPAA